MEFEEGETFRVDASVGKDHICYELGNVFTKVHDLHGTPVWNSCVVVVVAGLASPDLVDNISPDPLDSFHTFSLC